MATDLTSNQPVQPENEIDLIEVVKKLWTKRKFIIKVTVIWACLGVLVALFSAKEFSADCTIVPQTGDKTAGGNLGGLAAMAGINLGGSSEAGISPTLYPQITSSIPFQKELLQTPLTFEGLKKQITYEDYYTNYNKLGLLGYIKKYTIGLPGLLISTIKGKQAAVTSNSGGSSLLTITEEENELIKQLNDQIVLGVDKKDDVVSLSANMPEAIPAAEMAQKAQELLQQYIINFKIQKSTEQLKYIQDRYSEKEKEFRSAQQKLARFKDQNRFVSSEQAQISFMRLQAEYDLAYSVYTELAKQLETQQLQVKEDTPVFTILKPVLVPIEKSKPQKAVILIIWTFLGGILGVGIVFGSVFLSSFKGKWYEDEEITMSIDK